MTSRWTALAPNRYDHSGACVYAIYVDGELVYIGSTTDFCKRICQHKSTGSSWTTSENVLIKVSANRKYGEHAMREVRLIAKLGPKHNKKSRTGDSKPWIPFDGRRPMLTFDEWLSDNAWWISDDDPQFGADAAALRRRAA